MTLDTDHQEQRMRDVRAGPEPFVLTVTWAGGETDRVDLTGLIARSPHFRVFETDPDAFRNVAVADWGYTVEWANGLDWPAPNLKRLADEQRPVTGDDVRRWQDEQGLSNQEVADILGVTVKTFKNWRAVKAGAIPPTAQRSIRHFMVDPLALVAHYRPRRAGRPRLDRRAGQGKDKQPA